MSKDQVTLTVPARGEFARTVRMTAAELATRMGMTYDEVEDVRMALEEAFVYACDCMGEDENVTFVFDLRDGALSANVGPLAACDFDEDEQHYAELIIRSLCDEFSIDRDGEAATLRLSRRVGTNPGDAGE